MSDLVLYNDELITFQNPDGYTYTNADARLHLGTASEATYFIDPASGDYAGGVHGLRIYVPIASAANTKGPYGVSGNGYRTYGTDFLNVRYGDTLTMYYGIGTSGQYYNGNIHPYPTTGTVSFFSYALSDVIKVSAGNHYVSTDTTAFGRIANDGFQYSIGMNFSAATAGTTAATTSFFGGAKGYSWIDQNTSAWSAEIWNASARFTFAPNKSIYLYSANGTRASKLGSIDMSAIENYQNMRYSVFIMCDKYTQYVMNPFWEGPYGDFNYGYRSTSYRPDVPEFIVY
jgi:hypothetical protein